MNTIESLKELYVKLGGSLEDVENLSTIPEMIDAISEVAGGDAPSYETVAEIQVGDPLEDGYEGIPEGCTAYIVEDAASAKAIMDYAGDTLFLNSAKTPLTRHIINEMVVFVYNFTIDDSPVVTGQPAYIVVAGDKGEHGAAVELMSTEDLSNTTVRILKKVEEPSVLPAYDTTEDLGKVLTVTENGLAWVSPNVETEIFSVVLGQYSSGSYQVSITGEYSIPSEGDTYLRADGNDYLLTRIADATYAYLGTYNFDSSDEEPSGSPFFILAVASNGNLELTTDVVTLGGETVSLITK